MKSSSLKNTSKDRIFSSDKEYKTSPNIVKNHKKILEERLSLPQTVQDEPSKSNKFFSFFSDKFSALTACFTRDKERTLKEEFLKTRLIPEKKKQIKIGFQKNREEKINQFKTSFSSREHEDK